MPYLIDLFMLGIASTVAICATGRHLDSFGTGLWRSWLIANLAVYMPMIYLFTPGSPVTPSAPTETTYWSKPNIALGLSILVICIGYTGLTLRERNNAVRPESTLGHLVELIHIGNTWVQTQNEESRIKLEHQMRDFVRDLRPVEREYLAKRLDALIATKEREHEGGFVNHD